MDGLPDADKDQFPLPRFNPCRADRAGPGALYGSCAARGDEGDPGVAFVLLQESDARAGIIPRARLVHPIDEAEEHAAVSQRRRVDYTFGSGVLRLGVRCWEIG